MTSPSEQIAGIVTSAPAYVPPHGAAAPDGEDARPAAPFWDDRDGATLAEGDGPSLPDDPDVDPDIVAACAGLDHSDTDNAERLIRHFGPDMAVLAQEETHAGDWLGWAGTHWDKSGGAARVHMVAQRLGGRIGMEAAFLQHTPDEKLAVEAARRLGRSIRKDLDPDDKELLDAANAAREGLEKRKAKRRAFAVTSKNKGRIEAALFCAAPRLRRAPDSFNADRLRVATLTHTLTLRREEDQDVAPDGSPRFCGTVKAEAVHRREDWITAAVPVGWRDGAAAPRWRAFLERMLPDPEKRRTVQQFTALGLLGIPVQFVMFHFGLGANGKSVFLETIVRILGPGLAVGLPRESLVGGSERGAGSASPDLARLFGKRMVRILEVKGDVPLQEDLIKRLTGGEAIPVRTLFKGYFEFQPIATPHMSGNGKPTIDGTDHGIWRRMLLVHWDQTIPEAERRDFEEVVSEFVDGEGEGILAWLVEGALDYLANGLVIAPAVQEGTAQYRDEMDPIGVFAASCVRASPGLKVQAHTMYEAYVSWSLANSKRARSQTKFGTVMGQRFHKAESGGRLFYHECELHDVPTRPDTSGDPGHPGHGH